MAKTTRTKGEIERHRAQIADLYCRGWSQYKIADEVGISRPLVAYDLKAIRAEWLDSSLMDFNTRKAEEIAKIDRLEAYAWEMLDKSDGMHAEELEEESEREGVPSRKSATKRYTTIADSKWGKIALDCITKRCAILGVDAPTKIAVTDTEGHDVDVLTPEERALRAVALLAKAKERAAAADEPESDSD